MSKMPSSDGVQKTEEKLEYLAYLLRLWRTGLGENVVWRASLQDPQSGQRIGFASLDEVVEFLEQKMEEADRIE